VISIRPGRDLVRDLCLWHDRRWVVARITHEGVYFRGKKQRSSAERFLPWAAAYDTAVKMYVARMRREKLERKKARAAARARIRGDQVLSVHLRPWRR
jgi:hypothetical protein